MNTRHCKGAFRSIHGTEEPRYILLDIHTRAWSAYQTEEDRAKAEGDGEPIGRPHGESVGHGGGYRRLEAAYGPIEWEDATDYEQRYNDLVLALDKKAREKNWCGEWEVFAKENNIVLPKRKVRVEVEVEYDASDKDWTSKVLACDNLAAGKYKIIDIREA